MTMNVPRAVIYKMDVFVWYNIKLSRSVQIDQDLQSKIVILTKEKLVFECIYICVYKASVCKEEKESRETKKETSETSLHVDLWRQTVKLQPWHFN